MRLMQIWMAWALAFFLCIATPAQAMSASKALVNPLATGLDRHYFPINHTDPDGLAPRIRVTWSSGEVSNFTSMKDFYHTTYSRPLKTGELITSITPFGHAGGGMANIDATHENPNKKEGFFWHNNTVQLRDVNGNAFANVSYLNSRLAKGAEIVLHGCEAASGDVNIVWQMHKTLPKATVFGFKSETLGPVEGDWRFGFGATVYFPQGTDYGLLRKAAGSSAPYKKDLEGPMIGPFMVKY